MFRRKRTEQLERRCEFLEGEVEKLTGEVGELQNIVRSMLEGVEYEVQFIPADHLLEQKH